MRQTSIALFPRYSSRSNLLAALALIAALAAACGGGSGPTEVPAGPHPIVVVDLEGVRADRLGSYGDGGGTSPNIDALAAESVRFEWAFCQAPDPDPSLASIFTGLYPTTHGLARQGDDLLEDAVTLAEILSEHGYTTAAFTSSAGAGSGAHLFQGFEHFSTGGERLGQVGSKAIEWMKANASKDFLLVVRSADAAVAGEGTPAGAYDDGIRSVDGWIGEFMTEVRNLGLDERATIVLLSTHGEDVGLHPEAVPRPLYTSVTRVPLMIRLPGGIKAGGVPSIVETLDLMPTLLELADVPEPPGLQGASLAPLIRGLASPPFVAFGESPHRGGERFVAIDDYHLILNAVSGQPELYSLFNDPNEQTDLSSDEGEMDRVDELIGHLDAWEKMVGAASLDPEKRTEDLDEEALEQLRSLGYIQ
jgi:arylsulfatase A-like enzyme